METEIKTEAGVDSTNNKGEGENNASEMISISKKDYDTMNQTLGSLKRENKDLKKSKEEPVKETSTTNSKSDESRLAEKFDKATLRGAGITHQDDIDLAKATAKKWNMDLDDLVVDEDFKAKLEKQQTARQNLEATSTINKGGAGGSQAKNDPAYWQAKGVPPTPADVPDRKARAKILRSFMENNKSKKKFYND